MAERRFSEDEPVMVSIRCITYNHAPYIRQCLDGFVMQKTNFRFQAVVHDDASTDGTTDIVREYAEKYPDIIVPMYEEENRWSKHDGSLLTIMYPLLTGKYLAHCEGDDFWIDPNKLQKQVDFLENNPDYVLTYTDYNVVDDNSVIVFSNKPKRESGICTKKLILDGNFLCTPTTLYRRMYDNDWPEYIINLPIKVKQSDYVHWIYLSSKGKFKYLEEKTASYRVLEKSASHDNDYRKSKEFINSRLLIKSFFNTSLNIGIKEKSIINSYHYDCIRMAMKYDKSIFCHELYEGIKKSPYLLFRPKIWCMFFYRLIFNKSIG